MWSEGGSGPAGRWGEQLGATPGVIRLRPFANFQILQGFRWVSDQVQGPFIDTAPKTGRSCSLDSLQRWDGVHRASFRSPSSSLACGCYQRRKVAFSTANNSSTNDSFCRAPFLALGPLSGGAFKCIQHPFHNLRNNNRNIAHIASFNVAFCRAPCLYDKLLCGVAKQTANSSF